MTDFALSSIYNNEDIRIFIDKRELYLGDLEKFDKSVSGKCSICGKDIYTLKKHNAVLCLKCWKKIIDSEEKNGNKERA
jgi:DNA-directed RNA polymerase subunit RPC12/RpoP